VASGPGRRRRGACGATALLAELAKYGAWLTLATQTLGALVGPSGDHHLLDAVFGNTDHLFAFNCAAEQAIGLLIELRLLPVICLQVCHPGVAEFPTNPRLEMLSNAIRNQELGILR
jgi:hypothetical protein